MLIMMLKVMSVKEEVRRQEERNNGNEPERHNHHATRFIPLTTLVALTLAGILPAVAQDPLPVWNDTAPKKALVAFVERVTTSGAPDVVPPAERIGVARAWA